MIDKTPSRIHDPEGHSRAIARRRPPRLRRDDAVVAMPSERVRLITFVWSGRTGEQPVIYADRSWVQ
jgi:hypothetical protein